MNLDIQDLDLSKLVLTKWNETTLLDSWLPPLSFCCTDRCKLSEARLSFAEGDCCHAVWYEIPDIISFMLCFQKCQCFIKKLLWNRIGVVH